MTDRGLGPAAGTVTGPRHDLQRLLQRYRNGELPALGGADHVDESVTGYRRAAVMALFTPASDLAVMGPWESERDGAGGTGGDVAGPEGIDLFLVQRSPYLAHHPGQIALPGGGIDPGEDPMVAAMRETHEETGVPASQIEPLGALGTVLVPVSKNIVSPVLGWTADPQQVPHADAAEVLHPLRVSVPELLEPDQRATITFGDHESAGFRLGAGWIWGFTGSLLNYLFDELGWTRPWDQQRRHPLSWDEARGAAFRADGDNG